MSYESAIPDWEDMNAEERRAAKVAWSKGDLDWFVLPHQRTLWALICRHVGLPTRFDIPEEFKEVLARTSNMKPLVIEVARRFGKSSLVLLAMMALCIRKGKQTYYFVAPVEGNVKDIIEDVYPPLIRTCPPEWRPVQKNRALVFTFHNGSRIKIGGTFQKSADGLRGRAANGSAVDEAGSIPNYSSTSSLTYVVSSVLLPQLSTTKGWMAILSTPPPNLQHDYYAIRAAAQEDGRFIRMDVTQNSSYSDEDIQELKAATDSVDPSGGAWSREYMCIAKADAKTLIIPEGTQNVFEEHILAWSRPVHFEYVHRYISMDHGTVDLNAILFGYFDFLQAKLVVEREHMPKNTPTSKRVAAEINGVRENLWGRDVGGLLLPVERCIADAPPQVRIDLNAALDNLRDESKESKVPQFGAPVKTQLLSESNAREGMVNQLITALGDGQIIIDPSCKVLIETIRTGTWKVSSTGKREFARGGEIGHCDFLAALMYMWRGVYRNVNPYLGKVSPNIYSNIIIKREEPQGAIAAMSHVLNRTNIIKRPQSIFKGIFRR